MTAQNTAMQWHCRPAGFAGPCPVCGCPKVRGAEHRAVGPSEQFPFTVRPGWIKRHRSHPASTWQYKPVRAIEKPQPGQSVRRRPPGPCALVRSRIVRVCRLIALGRTVEEAAKLIDADMLVRFRSFLLKLPGKQPGSVATARSVCNSMRYVSMFLTYAGPIGRYNRDGLGVLQIVPWVRPPRADDPIPKIITFEQLDAVYRKAEFLATPQVPGILPADWWRALLVFTFNTGLRRRTLFGLEWRHIDFDRRVLTVPPELIKTRRQAVFPLNQLTVDHLAKINRGGIPMSIEIKSGYVSLCVLD